MKKTPCIIPQNLGNTLQVRVTPKASRNQVLFEDQPDGKTLVRVHVTAAPEDDKANKAVIKLLAKALGLPASSLEITHGHKGRDKVVRIR